MFASNTLLEHALRGLVGIGAVWYAVLITTVHPLGALAPGALALLAFRGCPMCWTVGLVETASQRWRRR